MAAPPSSGACDLLDKLKASLLGLTPLTRSCGAVQPFADKSFSNGSTPPSCAGGEVCQQLTEVLKSQGVLGCTFMPKPGASGCTFAPLAGPAAIAGALIPSEPSNNTVIIVVAVCGFLVIIAGVAAFLYVKRRTHGRKYSLASTPRSDELHQVYVAAPGEDKSPPPPPSFPYGRMSCPTFTDELNLYDLTSFYLEYDQVEVIKPLAQGAFGEVLLGRYGSRQVAVKTLKVANSAQEVQFFIWEILLLSKIECPYVVQFIGVTWKDSPSGIMLVTEFMDGGDLRTVLDANATSRRFSWRDKLECALHVAEGLVYLHSLDPKVIHRDLKSRNVMLDSVAGAKITDFGVARETNDATMTVGIGTYRWMAPEVLVDGHYSESADIFSFGVILAELSTEIVPYTDLSLTDAAIISKVMAGTLRPTFHATQSPSWFVELGAKCLAFDANERPTAAAVSYVLRKELQHAPESGLV